MVAYRFKNSREIKGATLAGALIATALLMTPPAFAADTGYAVTVYGGYRGGGSFTDANTGQGLKLESNGAVSLALDLPYDAARQYQIFVSQQRTNLLLDNAASAGSSNRLGMDIYYLHFGGTFFWDGQVGKGAYVVAAWVRRCSIRTRVTRAKSIRRSTSALAISGRWATPLRYGSRRAVMPRW